MPIEAPVSKYKKTNLLIYIVICIALAAWFAYDGYINQKFIDKHTDENGKPNSTLIFNQKSPPFFAAAAVFFTAYLFIIKNKKLIADENALVFSDKDKIPYDSIQSINKTYFEKKGFFVITHKDEHGKEINRKISDRNYDNLAAILDHLVAKIS
jgi:hypothetical protein